METKICSKCRNCLPIIEFNKDCKTRDGFKKQCNNCRKVLIVQWTLQNKARYKEKKRIWTINNRDKLLREKHEWYVAHRAECIARNKANKYDKYQRDIQFRLINVLRSRLNTAIKNNHKGGSAVRDLGCSIEEFKIYLESKFQEGMTWDNYGRHGWHIDHIRPLSSFDLTDPEQFKKACHYTNLQPLWAKDNLSKGAKKPS